MIGRGWRKDVGIVCVCGGVTGSQGHKEEGEVTGEEEAVMDIQRCNCSTANKTSQLCILNKKVRKTNKNENFLSLSSALSYNLQNEYSLLSLKAKAEQ